ncbi:MAG: hypothetical protein R3A47_09445 [Polyangiales bacterium]
MSSVASAQDADAIGWGSTVSDEDEIDPSAEPSVSDDLGWGDSNTTDGTLSSVEGDVESDDAAEPYADRWWQEHGSFTGFARSDWAVWTRAKQPTHFAKARQSLDLQLRVRAEPFLIVASGHVAYDLAYQYKRSEYDKPTIDEYEFLLRSGETYLAVHERGSRDQSRLESRSWRLGKRNSFRRSIP